MSEGAATPARGAPDTRLDAHALLDLVDGLPHPAWVRDLSGRWLLVNRAFEVAFGLPGPGSAAERLAGPAGPARDISLELDGITTHWLVVHWPLADGERRPVAIAGLATDVTRWHHARRRPGAGPRDGEPPATRT